MMVTKQAGSHLYGPDPEGESVLSTVRLLGSSPSLPRREGALRPALPPSDLPVCP